MTVSHSFFFDVPVLFFARNEENYIHLGTHDVEKKKQSKIIQKKKIIIT